MTSADYVGRFAPSPTGHLHFGSLLAAMASYCDARSQGGSWLVRIDDIDPPRAMPCATTLIPRSLIRYGFQWDGEIVFQSARTQLYQQHLLSLCKKNVLFLCHCTRKELIGHANYPGTCRQHRVEKIPEPNGQSALRVLINANVAFDDLIQGPQSFIVGAHFGDTVVVRRDDLFSYALCCAVDDADGISHVIRGSDLLPTTGVQVRLMQLLGLNIPTYAHIPVALNADQQKLSKQTLADPIDEMPVLPTLLRAWQFLGQTELNVHSVESFWQAAIAAWRLSRVPNCQSQEQ